LARQASDAVHAEKRSDKSVLDGIINSDAIPESDKTVDRITQEARTLVGAGSETTGNTLETITFHVLANPDKLQRLKKELAQAAATSKGSDNPLSNYNTLQRLPYLTAVINEGLRIACSVSGRLARVNHRQPYTYGAYVLPAGTVISMAIRGNHTFEPVYPEPLSFKPERWLVEGEELKKLEKYFVPFGRGGRSCIGKELAIMNLYLTIAAFFHEFDAELYETTRKDIEIEHDYFSPFPAVSSKGLRVVLQTPTK
jgi:cytochrome P450